MKTIPRSGSRPVRVPYNERVFFAALYHFLLSRVTIRAVAWLDYLNIESMYVLPSCKINLNPSYVSKLPAKPIVYFFYQSLVLR